MKKLIYLAFSVLLIGCSTKTSNITNQDIDSNTYVYVPSGQEATAVTDEKVECKSSLDVKYDSDFKLSDLCTIPNELIADYKEVNTEQEGRQHRTITLNDANGNIWIYESDVNVLPKPTPTPTPEPTPEPQTTNNNYDYSYNNYSNNYSNNNYSSNDSGNSYTAPSTPVYVEPQQNTAPNTQMQFWNYSDGYTPDSALQACQSYLYTHSGYCMAYNNNTGYAYIPN